MFEKKHIFYKFSKNGLNKKKWMKEIITFFNLSLCKDTINLLNNSLENSSIMIII